MSLLQAMMSTTYLSRSSSKAMVQTRFGYIRDFCTLWYNRGLTALYVFLTTIYIKLTCKKPKITSCLNGKIALVTGGNSGIGYDVCVNLASRGCSIIIADVNDSEQSRQEIIKLTGNPNVTVKRVDLASFKSVREFANDLKGNLDKLDIFVSNAGIAAHPIKHSTEDGLHPVMQVNYFSHFLLTHLLIDVLKKSGSGRVLYTSSAAAFFEELDMNNLNANRDGIVYGNSKLALIIAAKYFTEKIKGVTFNAIHPGILPSTKIFNTISWQTHGWFLKLVSTVLVNFLFLSRTCWAAAEYMVYLVSSKDLEGISGKFYFEDRMFGVPVRAEDVEFSKELIKLSEDIVKLLPQEKM